MALTPNLGLHYYGGDIGGSINDNASQHTAADRLLLDKLITQLATTSRYYTAPIADVRAAFSLDLNPTGGRIPNGVTWYYKVGIVGLDGLERIASSEQGLSTPALLGPPAAPGLRDGTGGSLAPGLYYYALTAKGTAAESSLGPAATVNVYAGINQAITVDAPIDSQGVPLQVWRKKDTDAGYTRIATVAAGDSAVDDGSVPAEAFALNPAYAPPQANTGSATNTITITLVGEAADAASQNKITAWRVYRSAISGFYSGQSLVHEVVEKDSEDGDPQGPLRIAWVDTGDGLAIGGPQVKDQSLPITPYSPESVTALPTVTTGYPEGYLIIFEHQLYALIDGTWSLVQGGSAVTVGDTLPSGGLAQRRPGDIHLRPTLGDWYILDAGRQWLLALEHRPALLSGEGAPASSLGLDKDFYLDSTATPAALYGPKANGIWPSEPISLGGGSGGSTIYTSPNGDRFRQEVTDDGTFIAVPTDEPGPPATPSVQETP